MLNGLTSVRRKQLAAQKQSFSAPLAQTGQRHLTIAFQPLQQAALGLATQRSGLVLKRLNQLQRCWIVFPEFKPSTP